ncbi:MAG: NAD(P)H-dependent oxidoreductase [Chitinophagaceae bacterium]|nr:NAD(P)H-dependent oxidoreductase [Chitinophagaceae bacterium]
MYTVISGTNRKGSNTLKVAELYVQILRKKGIEAGLLSLVDLDVHLRNESIERIEKEILIPSERFVIISPEYNGSFPGVLKSLLDITDIRQKVWEGKKVLLTGVSTGRAGNLRGMEHLTGVLHYLKMNVHCNKLPISIVHQLIDKDELISDTATINAIDRQLAEFIEF